MGRTAEARDQDNPPRLEPWIPWRDVLLDNRGSAGWSPLSKQQPEGETVPAWKRGDAHGNQRGILEAPVSFRRPRRL
jgi:hypothetical protein